MSSTNEFERRLQELSKEDLIKIILVLSSEMEQLRADFEKLKNRLAIYENSNTPSSQQRFKPDKKKDENDNKPRFPGAPLNHKGAGIKLPKPDRTVEHKIEDKTLKCIGKYTRTIIDFVEKPLEVVKHVIYQYRTKDGQIVESEVNLPDGVYGENLQAFVTEMKSIGGVSYEKIANLIKTLRPDLSICPATILSLIDGISKNLEKPRKNVLSKIRKSDFVQADETGMRQDGENGYVWAFCNPNYALYEYDISRAKTVLGRVLGSNFNGYTVNDGYAAYNMYKNQRCWAHILREADYLEEKYPESKLQVELLHQTYNQASAAKSEPPDQRLEIIKRLSGQTELGHIIKVMSVTNGCKKFAGTLQRALPNLFVGVEHPEIPLHNNFAERTIRPVVIHRKMMGCIRNDKGKRLINNLLSMTQTWKLQNKPLHKMLIKYAN